MNCVCVHVCVYVFVFLLNKFAKGTICQGEYKNEKKNISELRVVCHSHAKFHQDNGIAPFIQFI